jgi:hypothetical protein
LPKDPEEDDMMGDILKKDGASKSDSKETDEVSMMGGEEK